MNHYGYQFQSEDNSSMLNWQHQSVNLALLFQYEDDDDDEEIQSPRSEIFSSKTYSTSNIWQGGDDESHQSSGGLFSSGEDVQPPRVIEVQNHIDHAMNRHLPNNSTMDSGIPELLMTKDVERIMEAGLSYAGFDATRQKRNTVSRKIDWFKAFYGVEPSTVAPFFSDVKNEYPTIMLKDFLMTMNWICLYETYPILSGRWKYCEEYIGSKVLEYGMLMRNVAVKKIVFELEHDVELGRTVDCCTFMVNEMRLDPSYAWFDYKTHSCGLKYEFCLATREARVCHISGPHVPSKHDITVFRGGDSGQDEEDRDQSALYFKIKEGERCIGDAGYSGEPTKVVVTKDQHSSEFKEFLARAKNRQETFHWRLKSFNILRHRFRHGVNTKERMRLHKMAVELVAGIVQYDYENGHPPFDIC